MSRFICVASLLDPQSTQRVEAIWRELEERFGLRGVSVTPFAHLTYQIAWHCDEDRLAQRLADLAGASHPFLLRSSGLGLFTGEHPVLYLNLVRSHELDRVHSAVGMLLSDLCPDRSDHYESLNWEPHITLAQGDLSPENLPDVMGLLGGRALNWEMTVDNLVLMAEDGDRHCVYKQFSFGATAPVTY